MSYAVGIDLGGTKTAAGLVSSSGEVLYRREAPTPASDGPDAVLATAIRLAEDVIAVAEAASPPTAVGVGSAGVIDAGRRMVLSATDTLPGWAGTAIGERVEAALGLPVAVDNDVRAHAVGEALFGAGRGHATVLVIAAGTGVGGALVLDGRPLHGGGSVAGHFGHMPSVEAQGLPCTCGRDGHLEMIASGPAVLAGYLRSGGPVGPVDTREVFALAEHDDPLALAAVRTAGRALGRAIGGLMNALDPDVVVVAGGLAHTSVVWWDPLHAGVEEECIDLVRRRPVVAAALGADAAIVGAGVLALATHREPRHSFILAGPTSGVSR